MAAKKAVYLVASTVETMVAWLVVHLAVRWAGQMADSMAGQSAD